MRGKRQSQDASLTEHDIVVELVRQALEHLQRTLIEAGARRIVIVGPDDGRIASCIATAQPAFLDHRDIANAPFTRKVIRGGEPVTAAANDDYLICFARRGSAPHLRPVALCAQAGAEQARCGKPLLEGDFGAGHRVSCGLMADARPGGSSSGYDRATPSRASHPIGAMI